MGCNYKFITIIRVEFETLLTTTSNFVSQFNHMVTCLCVRVQHVLFGLINFLKVRNDSLSSST